MPRDSSGTYTPPSNSFYPAQANTNVDPNDWNETIGDVANSITGSMVADFSNADFSGPVAKILAKGDLSNVVANIPGTTGFFAQNGAAIQKLNDRIFVGGATTNDGAYPNISQDWFTRFQLSVEAPGFIGSIASAQAAILTQEASPAVIGMIVAAQTAHFNNAGQTAIGLFSAVVNNPTTVTSSGAWAHYIEAHHRSANAGVTYGTETDVESSVATQSSSPTQQGNVVAHQIAAGAGIAGHDVSVGLQFVANPTRFQTGLNFLFGSVSGPIIAAPTGSSVNWYNSSGAQLTTISCSGTDPTKSISLLFSDNGLQFSHGDGTLASLISGAGSGSANYVSLQSGATGNAAAIAAQGSDTNVSLALATAGVGVIQCAAPISLKSYTVATKPSASTVPAGTKIFLTDAAGGACSAESNGAAWHLITLGAAT